MCSRWVKNMKIVKIKERIVVVVRVGVEETSRDDFSGSDPRAAKERKNDDDRP